LREEEKLVAIAVSIAAVLVNAQYAFILAEIVWFIVFARAGWEATETRTTTVTVSTTLAVSDEPIKSKNQCPAQLKKAIDESLEMFIKNREGDTTCDGEKWELQSDSNGDKVWKAKYPGQSIYRWRAESTLFGPKSGVIGEMFDYAKRAGPSGWDINLAKGRIHKEFDDNYKVLIYSTNPVYGGAVSSREFVEGRVVKPNQPNGAHLLAGLGLDEKVWGAILGADFPKGDKGCTRALAFPGGGFYMWPVDSSLDPETPQEWRYQLVVNTALGGWLPTVTINAATAQVLADATRTQKQHLLTKFKPSA
jgi:hypothetical protein